MSKFRLAALAASVAIPMGLASGAAQAQVATYCNGRMVANAFYNNVQSSGRTSTVSYYVQLQSRSDTLPVLYTVRFTLLQAQNRQTGTVVASLPPYQQVTVLLGRQTFNNPGGTGALNPTDMANGVPHYTVVDCSGRAGPQ